MVTIDRERLICEKQNNKASAEGERLPKEAILLRDIFKFTKPSLDLFRPFGLISMNNLKVYLSKLPLDETAVVVLLFYLDK